MRIALYLLGQVLIFFATVISLRLSFFPAGPSPDWAITLGYGSLLILPLILTKHNKDVFYTTIAIGLSWLACRFTGDDLFLPIIVYFLLTVVSGLRDQWVVPIISAMAAIYTAILLKVYTNAGDMPVIHQITLNLMYASTLLYVGCRVCWGANEDETPISDSYEDYREAA